MADVLTITSYIDRVQRFEAGEHLRALVYRCPDGRPARTGWAGTTLVGGEDPAEVGPLVARSSTGRTTRRALR